jgi:hypothetical protein
MQPRDEPPSPSRPWGRVSTIRLETFSDGVFAIAITLVRLWSARHRRRAR